MTTNIEEYARAVQCGEIVQQRMGIYKTIYDRLIPDQDWTIFTCNLAPEAGNTVWTSVWLLSDRYICESKLAVGGVDVDACLRSISRVNLRTQDFAPGGELTAASRLFVDYSQPASIHGSFTAAGANCEYLWDLAQRFLLPNV